MLGLCCFHKVFICVMCFSYLWDSDSNNGDTIELNAGDRCVICVIIDDGFSKCKAGLTF